MGGEDRIDWDKRGDYAMTIEVIIDTGSKLWAIHSQGQRDEVVSTGPGDKMHILHSDWIAQKLGIVIGNTSDSPVVNALYCAMVLSLKNEPKSDRRDAVFQGFLQRYEAYKEAAGQAIEADFKALADLVVEMIEGQGESEDGD